MGGVSPPGRPPCGLGCPAERVPFERLDRQSSLHSSQEVITSYLPGFIAATLVWWGGGTPEPRGASRAWLLMTWVVEVGGVPSVGLVRRSAECDFSAGGVMETDSGQRRGAAGESEDATR